MYSSHGHVVPLSFLLYPTFRDELVQPSPTPAHLLWNTDWDEAVRVCGDESPKSVSVMKRSLEARAPEVLTVLLTDTAVPSPLPHGQYL